MGSRVAAETSVRDLGDRKHVVVYTRERDVFGRLRDWHTCERVQTYEVWPDATPVHARVVAWDLYFPISERQRLQDEVSPRAPRVTTPSTTARPSNGVPKARTHPARSRVAGPAPKAAARKAVAPKAVAAKAPAKAPASKAPTPKARGAKAALAEPARGKRANPQPARGNKAKPAPTKLTRTSSRRGTR